MVYLGQSQPERPLVVTLIGLLWLSSGLYTVYVNYVIVGGDISLFAFLSNASVPGWYRAGVPAELFFSTMLLLLGVFQLVAVPGFLVGKFYSYIIGWIVPVVSLAVSLLSAGLYLTAPAGFRISSDLSYALFAVLISSVLVLVSWRYLGQTRVKTFLEIPPPNSKDFSIKVS
jgi:hypothetical protein